MIFTFTLNRDPHNFLNQYISIFVSELWFVNYLIFSQFTPRRWNRSSLFSISNVWTTDSYYFIVLLCSDIFTRSQSNFNFNDIYDNSYSCSWGWHFKISIMWINSRLDLGHWVRILLFTEILNKSCSKLSNEIFVAQCMAYFFSMTHMCTPISKNPRDDKISRWKFLKNRGNSGLWVEILWVFRIKKWISDGNLKVWKRKSKTIFRLKKFWQFSTQKLQRFQKIFLILNVI